MIKYRNESASVRKPLLGSETPRNPLANPHLTNPTSSYFGPVQHTTNRTPPSPRKRLDNFDVHDYAMFT